MSKWIEVTTVNYGVSETKALINVEDISSVCVSDGATHQFKDANSILTFRGVLECYLYVLETYDELKQRIIEGEKC